MNGGADARWRRDGKELFFIAADRKMMAVDIQSGGRFEAGIPRPLFDTRVSGLTDVRTHYAVTADGQRFLSPAGSAATENAFPAAEDQSQKHSGPMS